MANQQHWTQIALNDPDIKSWYAQLRFDHPNEPENVLLHMANSIQNYGSGSGNGFDYKTAIESGIKPELQPDGKYHWLGETPDKILKGPNHPTRSLTDQSRVEQTIQANKGRVDQQLQLAETQKEVKTNLVELVQQYPEARNVIMSMVKDGVHDIGTIAKLAREEVQKKRPESLVPKTKWEKLKTSFSRGKQNIAMDLLWFEFMTGTGKLEYKDLVAMTDEFEKQQAADPINADGWVEEILIPTANFAPSMWASIQEGFKGAAMGGGAAAAYTALTPIPDELIAVPTFMATGAQANVAKFWYMQGAGSIYRDQVRKGVNEDIANVTASIGALPYAMIEAISMKGLIPVSLKKEFVDVIAGGVATGLKKVGKKAGAEYGKQVGQEVAQEVTLIASEETATWLNNKIMDGSIPQAEGQEMLDRLQETFVESAKGLIIPVGLGGGVSAAKVITDADAKKKSEALVEEQVALDSMSPERAQLTKVEKEENRETQPTAKLEVQAALESEEISPGSASIANYLLDQDPEFDSRASLEISNEVLQMNDDYIINVLGKDPEQFYEEEGITKEEAESGEYFATGSTTVDFQKNATRTAIKLYKGHDADTIVEEFYHDFYEHMPEKDRKSFAKYHEESGDTRSIEEHFGQEGRDFFFSEKMHEKAGGLRQVFDNVKQTLTDLIARIRKIRGAKIPKRIQNLYTKAGTRQLKPLTAAQKKKIKVQKAQFQLRQKPKSKEFKKWFGDSKVVDDKGQPLVVYHGTTKDFDEFKGANYFTENPDVANTFAGDMYLWEDERFYQKGGRVFPAYLNIKKPLEIDFMDQKEIEMFLGEEIDEDYFADYYGSDMKRKIINKAQKDGIYDGVILKENYEPLSESEETSFDTAYITFKPNQIKGQFNPKPDKASPKIMHQVKKKTAALRLNEKPRSKEFQNWFKGSEVKENGKPMVMYHGTTKNIDSFNQMSYFTPSPDVANFYARDHRGYTDDPGTDKGAQVYPVYLDIKNSFDISKDPLDSSKNLDLGTDFDLDDWLVTLNEFLTDHKKEKLTKEEDQQIYDDFVKEVTNPTDARFKMDGKGFKPKAYATLNFFPMYRFIDNNMGLMNALKARGFDGIAANEDTVDGATSKVYIAFDPEQIKSQFNVKPDKKSPKIMFQVKKKPKQQPGGKPFEQWSPITDKEAKNSPRLEIFQHLQKKNTFLTNNPLDRGMVMVGNIGQLELQDQGTYPFRQRNEGKKTVKLSAIMAFDKGQGNGNKLLEMLKEAADETGTIIEGYAKQIGIEGPNTDELAKWYNRKGFNLHKFNDYFDIEYIPEQLKEKTIEISELTLKDFEKDSAFEDEIIYQNKENNIEITHRRDINEWSVFDLEEGFNVGDFTSKEEALEQANGYIEDKSFGKELDRNEQIEKGDLIPGKKPIKLSGKMKKVQFQVKKLQDLPTVPGYTLSETSDFKAGTKIKSIVRGKDMINTSSNTPPDNAIYELKKINIKKDPIIFGNRTFSSVTRDDFLSDDYDGFQTRTFEDIKQRMEKGGMESMEPLIFDNFYHSDELEMIDGHHRAIIANELGWDEIYAYVRKPDSKTQFQVKDVPKDIVNRRKFFAKNIGGFQRGRAEDAMLEVQKKIGGGVMNYYIESMGDIINRTYGSPHEAGSKWDQYKFGASREKVKRTLSGLEYPYGFEKEHKENMAAAARYNKISLKEHTIIVDAALQEYRDAHDEIPAFNRAQRLIKEANLALADGNYDKAIRNLQFIRNAQTKGATYEERLANWNKFIYEMPGDRKNMQYSNKKTQFQLKRVGTTKQFVGFPKGINTRSKLSTLRKRVEELADQGEVGKNWYDNSAQAALDLAGGDMKQAELILDLIAVTSAGMPVKSNTGQAVKLMYQIAQGDIKGAGRFPARVQGWVKALAEGKNLKESINDAKLISFAENLKRSLTAADDNRVTVDVWMMRAYGFPNEVPTGAQYKTVAEDVRRIATKRGWTPKQTQAAIWVGAKARWETIGGNKMPLKKALRLMKSTPASQERLDIAKVDYADAMKIYEGRISFEFIPSTRSDILPGIHEASYEQKMEYHKDMSEVITDDKGKNIIAKELKIPEVRSLDGPGFWEGAVSPSKQVEVLVPSIASAKDIKDKIDPNFFKTVDVHNSIVGLLFHQDAVGTTKELKPASLKQANSTAIIAKEGLTTKEFKSISDLLGDDFGIMPTNYGGIVVNFADENGNPFSGIDNNAFNKKVEDAAESALEGSDKTIRLQRAQSIGNLTEDYSNGKDYKRRISESRQRSAATRVFNQVSGDIQKINERYSKKYGWGNPGKSQKVVFAVRPKRLIPKQKTPKQLAGPDSNFGIELDPENYTQLFNRKIVDKMNRLGYVMDKFKEVREISDEEDAYLAQELYIGKTRELMDRFEEDIFGREDSLLPRIIKAGYSMDDFGSYLHARHALERNKHVAKINEDLPDGGSGMTNDQAKEILKQYKGDKKIEALAKEFYRKVTKRGLRMRLNSGLIDRKTYDYLNDYYKDYVPLFVIKDVENRTIVGKGFSTPQGSELKRVKGSAKVRGNPVFSAIYEMMGVMRRSEKNKVAAKFLNLAEEMQSESWKIEKMRYRPQFNKDGEVEFMQPQFKMDDNILAVRRDGDLYLITIEDEALASGLKNLGAEKTYKYLNQANAYIRSIVTTFNPEFIVTNFFRDIQTALVHLGGEYDGVAKTAAANVTKAMGGVWKNVRGDRTVYWSKMYDELKKEGGKVGWFDMASLDEHQEKVEKALKGVEDGKGGVVQAGKDFLELIEQANEAVESGIRLATYEALVKKGLSKKKAAQAAKNITVNFNKKGEWSTLFNTFYLFFNATVQGNARIAKSIINSKKTRMIVGGMVANSMIWSLRNYHMNDDEWEKKNHWEKDNYLMWMNRDGTAYKVKVPYGYNIFHVAGQAIADGIHQTKKNGAKYVDYIGLSSRVLKAASDAVSPFGDGSLLQAISPTVLDPIVQLAENKNFAGTPFMKPKYYDRSKPNFSNYYEKNPPSWVSRWTTESLSLISGGRRYKGLIKKRDGTVQDHTIPGVIDVNPDALDHIFGFLTGGTGKFFQRSFDLGMNFSQNKSTEVSKIPFIRQFYSKPDLTGATEKRLIFKMKYEAKHTIYNHVEVSKFKKYVHDAIKFGALAEKDIKLVKDHNGKMVPKIINDFLKHQRLARGEAEPTKKKKRKVVL